MPFFINNYNAGSIDADNMAVAVNERATAVARGEVGVDLKVFGVFKDSVGR